MARAPAAPPPPPPGSLVITYPDGDTVTRSFNCSGTATGATIGAVAVKDDNGQVVDGMTWQTINEPGDNGGNFLISVTLPASATGSDDPYSITVVDSDTNSDTKSFNL